MRRQFCHTYTVRYDECDAYGFLTPAAFLRYMQDIAGLDSEDVGFVGDGFWVVKRTFISFLASIPLHTQLVITTYGMGFTRITAQRGYEAHLASDPDGEPVISARTLWVYVDKRGRPMRIPEGAAALWLPDGAIKQTTDSAFPSVPTAQPERIRSSVRFSDTDYMLHLNNAATVEKLDNAAWMSYRKAGIVPAEIEMTAVSYDIEYIASVPFDAPMTLETWLEPLPAAGCKFTRVQQVMYDGNVAIRADSRWFCKAIEH